MIYVFYAAAGLIVLALCMTAMRDYGKFLFFGAFFLNFHAISVDVGVLLTLDKVFAWIGGFVILSMGLRLPRRGWFHAFAWMIGYMTLLTTFMMSTGALATRIAYAHSMGWGTGQTSLRLPVQIVSQISVWLILLVGYTLGRHEQIINGFIWGAVCNAGLGFYQVLAAIKGLPWLPPDLLTKWSGGQANAQFQVKSSSLFRLAGLAGEPKHAAACFVFAIVLMMCFPVKGKKWKLSIVALALIATLSTSGWFAFAVIYGVFMFYRRKFMQLSLAAFFVLVIILATQVNTSLAFIVNTRIVARFADPTSYEYKDAAMLDVAKHEPAILFTGAGAGGIDLFLMRWVKTSTLERGGTLSPTYILTELLGDYGVIGVTLFALLLLSMRPYFRGDLRVFYIATVLALIMLPRFTILPPVLLVLGGAMRAIDDEKEESEREILMGELEAEVAR
jgi:hypothetical protein